MYLWNYEQHESLLNVLIWPRNRWIKYHDNELNYEIKYDKMNWIYYKMKYEGAVLNVFIGLVSKKQVARGLMDFYLL